jgi:hypothetical protein
MGKNGKHLFGSSRTGIMKAQIHVETCIAFIDIVSVLVLVVIFEIVRAHVVDSF